jgi:hypothetical protein
MDLYTLEDHLNFYRERIFDESLDPIIRKSCLYILEEINRVIGQLEMKPPKE